MFKKLLITVIVILWICSFVPLHADYAPFLPKPGIDIRESDIKVDTEDQGIIPIQKPNIELDSAVQNTPEMSMVIKAPSNLRAVSEYEKIILTWEDNSTNESGFIIERKVGSGEFYQVGHVDENIETYVDTGAVFMLHPDEIYYYRVKAFIGNAESESSNETNGNYYYTEIPMPAYDLAIDPLSPDVDAIRIKWKNIINHPDTDYYVEVSENGGPFKQLAKVQNNHTSYTDIKSDKKVGVPYYYRIKTSNLGHTVYSEQESIVVPHKPELPTEFRATTQGSTSIKLTWVDNSDREDGFLITRNTLDENYQWSIKAIMIGKDLQQFIDSGLEPETWHYYTIHPYNGGGHSEGVPGVYAYSAPPPPTNLSAVPLETGGVELSWSNQTQEIYCIKIERRKDGEPWAEIDQLINVQGKPAPDKYTDTDTTPGTKYYYRCFAFVFLIKDPDGNLVPSCKSDPSAETSVITKGGTGYILNNPALTGEKVIRLNIGKTDYFVNGQSFTMDAAPVLIGGRTMLPIKCITDALGADLAWDGTEKKATITKEGTVIEFWINSNTARVNGAETLIDADNPSVVPVLLPPGRTMLPLRFISENLGCEVNWNQELKEINLIYGKK
ncbi:MAG: hypothetical protein KBB40_03340 [Clostridia bacterium]|jgi:titin|nr:hypothetical protein [Clostridia bacterium]HOH89079.1 stalk domain-containing protein [Bacillota bacterium]